MKKQLLGLSVALLSSMSMFAVDLEYTFTPADGSTVSEISTINFTVNGVTPTISEKFETTDCVIKRNGAIIDWGWNMRDQPRFTNGQIYIPSTQTTEATYTFDISEGAWIVNIDGTDYPCPAYTYTLKVGTVISNETSDVAYTVTPANGGNVTAPLSEVSVKFDTTEQITFSESMSVLTACNIVYNGTTLQYGTDFTEGDDITTLVFETPLEENGEVTVNIPEGFYIVGTKKSPAISWTFAIGDAKIELPALTYVLSPANGSVVNEAVSQIRINFDTTVQKVELGAGATKYGFMINVGGRTLYAPNGFQLDANNPTLITLTEPISTDATVRVEIDEDYYSLTRTNGDVVSSPALNWSFSVKMPLPAVTYTLTPANGSVVKEAVDRLQVKFDNTVEKVALGDGYGIYACAIIVNGSSRYIPRGFSLDPDDPTILILKEPITTDATVSVIMDPDYYTLTRTDGTVVSSPGIDSGKWNFTVAPENVFKVDYTVTPASETVVDAPLKSISVKFDTTEEIGFTEDMSILTGYTVEYNGKTLTYAYNFTEGDDITEMIFDEPIDESAKVTVNIPEGFYLIGGHESPAISWTFTVKGNEPSIYTVSPADGSVVKSVEDLKSITINLPEGYTFVGLAQGWLQTRRYLYYEDANGNRTAQLSYIYDNTNTANGLVYNAENYNADNTYPNGKYVFVLPARSFNYSFNGTSTPCEAQEYTFTVDPIAVGVDKVEAEDTFTVFTLTGVCMMRNANADALNTLPAGFYIINGKKACVK